jgi:diacylglycerol O-acyltransferase
MDRMSALDASFWDLESEAASLHIGGIGIFEGPAPSGEEIHRRYASRVARLARYQQRMQTVPFGLARPVWVRDPDFELRDHLHRTALPAPGDEAELVRLFGRLMSQELDRGHPLWEAWTVEGLADGRWALITKVHHSMVDGIAGMALFTDLLDDSPGTAHSRPRRTVGEAPPTRLRLVADGLGDRVAVAGRALRLVAGSPLHPRALIAQTTVLARGLPRYLRLVRPSPSTSLTGHLDRPRRYRTLTVELADVNAVRHAFGGSINDVVLAMVTAGFRAMLQAHGERPAEHTVRCLVPVSVRVPDDGAEPTNRVSALVVELPVEFGEPEAAYGAVRARVTEMKRSHEAEAGELVVALAEALPAAALSSVLRAALRVPHRALTTVATNVPGPRLPVSLLGRRMVAVYPYVPIADVLRIGIAVTSYDGHLHFGVTYDRASMPDADVLVDAMAAGLADLTKSAAETRAREEIR